jgi:hypothetical protein
LLKYYFTPTAEAIAETKLDISGNEDTIYFVVRAESREEAQEFAISIINMNNWELSHSEE